MHRKEKIDLWLDRLKLFAVNAEVHCAREERAFHQEHIGTRHVNQAFNHMIQHMHHDLEVPYDARFATAQVIEGGKQILLFTIGDNAYYTDIAEIHEVIAYPTQNYKQYPVSHNAPMVGILNWYEGLIPVIQTHALLNLPTSKEKYLLVYDIEKEIFGFTITTFYAKHEIEPNLYGQSLTVGEQTFNCLDFSEYAKSLIQIRMGLTL